MMLGVLDLFGRHVDGHGTAITVPGALPVSLAQAATTLAWRMRLSKTSQKYSRQVVYCLIRIAA